MRFQSSATTAIIVSTGLLLALAVTATEAPHQVGAIATSAPTPTVSPTPTPTPATASTPEPTPSPMPPRDASQGGNGDDVPWSAVSAIATVSLALAAIFGYYFGFRRYLQQRQRELMFDTLKGQADLVQLLRNQAQRAARDFSQSRRIQDKLNREENVLESLLRAVVASDPELLKFAQQQIDALLEENGEEQASNR